MSRLGGIADYLDMLEAAPVAMLAVDVEGRIVLVNRQIEELFGYARQELLGRPVEVLVPEHLRARHREDRVAFFARPQARPMGAGRELFGRRRDGREVPVEIGLKPLAAADGAFVLSSIVDITERTKAWERVQASLREKEILLKEVHHRVKNNLQVVSSLLSLQGHHTPEATGPLGEMQNRVRSIALFHEKLYRSDDLAEVDAGEYLRDLAAILPYHYGIAPDRVGVRVRASDVHLGVDQAIPCGLIANELVSNALKHAFPGERKGRIEVTLGHEGDEDLALSVQDDGVGLPETVDPQHSPTLGLKLVRTLARQLEGSIEIERNGGTRVVVRFPEAPA